MEAAGDDNEITSSTQDIEEISCPESNSAKENQVEESAISVDEHSEHNNSVDASNAEDNNEDQMDVTEAPLELITHTESQDTSSGNNAADVSTDFHTPDVDSTVNDNERDPINVDSDKNDQSLAESNKEGNTEDVEDKEESPENIDSNKEGNLENIESNKEGSPENIESSKEGSPENIESNKDGSPENIESNKEGSPENIESNEGGSENVESNKEGGSENDTEGDPENIESNKGRSPENIESNKESSSENAESNKEEGSENVESNKEGNTENRDPNKEGSVENDSTSQDFTTEEDPVFVHVNTEKDDNDKSVSTSEQDEPDVDPIGSSDWVQNNENETRTEEDHDECIIPDTNRVLTQEEKDAATNIRDPTDLEQPSSNSEIELPPESENPEWKGKHIVNICTTEVCKKCMMCGKEMTTKYTCTLNRKQTFICSEGCLKQLKEQNAGNVIIRDLRVKNFTPQEVDNLMPSGGIDSRHCMDCGMIIRIKENLLSWETQDFCSEGCLTKYQKRIGSYCANCNFEVSDNFLGKYCVRFGYNIRQFCSSNCLEEYKKGLKVCSYCQEDMSGNTCGFLASIGDKGLFKDFCSAQCMEKYNSISKHRKGNKPSSECCVCHKVKPMEIEFEFKNKMNTFCSDPCFVAFKFVNNAAPDKCDMCSKFVLKSVLAQNSMFYDGNLRSFCTKTCQNIYITTHRKIVSCCWCKVKKYNFDMIQKCSTSGQVLMMCSLNCLNLFSVSISVAKTKKRCDNCNKHCRGQYHMTLPDSTKKHFCSYPCVQAYQTKYSLTSVQVTHVDGGQINTVSSAPKRITRKSMTKVGPRKQIIPDVPGPLPIITSVRSLAPTKSPVTNGGTPARSLRSKNAVSTTRTASPTVVEPPTAPPIKKIVLVRPPDLPSQRNIATLVKPITLEVGVGFKPICFDKAVQTDNLKDSLVIVPIPVPIYVPSPAHMYSLPFPIPIPFPLPIPVPIFIPTTKNTSSGILKEIKKIQVRTPTDPYEADLLMMAELVAVAGDKKEEREESESDAADDDAGDEGTFSPEPQDASNTFGEDMLQMALKMATDFDEPAVDLEGALTASTITASQGNETHPSTEEQIDDPPPVQPAERPPFRGRKRGRPARHGGRGRGRGRPPNNPVEVPMLAPPEPPPPPEPVEKPDANMCLKYTFGVNAWKQWVTTKNADLEKSSRRVKLFKTEILQLTSDELNYSLCLFVKEVRKPNGAEYAPDTIYYLCLGIQQYLFENGRIDNIFCDSYYEKFTDCLDEVCRKFSSLYNDSQYIVTRVEEEHLWESKQLGAHSPHVLLSTLMFFNTKHFNLTNVEEHMQLSFSHIMKHWKRVPNQPGGQKTASSRNILLRFYPPQSAIEGNLRKKKVYEQQENEENPLRCPVKLYEFYLSKCPESVKTRNDVFYLLPERSCVPDSPVWYSTMALGKEALEKMLHRVKMVKEINVALLAS